MAVELWAISRGRLELGQMGVGRFMTPSHRNDPATGEPARVRHFRDRVHTKRLGLAGHWAGACGRADLVTGIGGRNLEGRARDGCGRGRGRSHVLARGLDVREGFAGFRMPRVQQMPKLDRISGSR